MNSRPDLFDGTNYVITKNWGENFLIAVQKVDGKRRVLGTGMLFSNALIKIKFDKSKLKISIAMFNYFFRFHQKTK